MGNLRLINDGLLVNRPDDQRMKEWMSSRYSGTKIPTIGVPSQSLTVPFTRDEVDSLSALRDKDYDPYVRERKLMDAVGLASILVQPVRQLYKLVTRPIQGGLSRIAAYFDGMKLVPVTRSARVSGSVAASPQEAGELAQMALTKPGETVTRVGNLTERVGPQPLYEYRTPINTSSGPAVLREVKPGPRKYKCWTGDCRVTIDRGVDKVAPDFAGMAKRGPRTSGPVSSEIITTSPASLRDLLNME